MKRFLNIRAAALGTAVAAAACAASFALAVFGLGRLYYASVFMPVAMLACLSIAWFSFLRDDGLARRSPDEAPAPPPTPPEAAPTGLPDLSLYAPRDGGLVPRRPAPARSPRDRPGSLSRAALVWAAIELGAAAALLYTVAGVGSRFY